LTTTCLVLGVALMLAEPLVTVSVDVPVAGATEASPE